MLFRTPQGRQRPLRKANKLFTPRVRVEQLEQRLMLSVSAADLDSPPNDEADARQAAQVDFDGPDLTGKDGPMARIGFDLDLLYEEQKIHDERHPGTTFAPSNSELVVSGGNVLVDAVATGNAGAFGTQLSALGIHVTDTIGTMVEGVVPIASLNQLAALGTLNFARPSYKPMTSAGSVESQGDAALRADLARASFGVDGTGVTVGVLSNSFDEVKYPGGVDGVAHDIATGDLPAQTNVLEDSPIPGEDDEGRAMAQIDRKSVV
jgi:hypothetical protein